MKSFFKSFIVRILTAEAKAALRKYRPRIVAITGTVGKTTTKDAVAVALSAFFRVRKSEKSYNSEIGVPLTILGLPNGWNNPFIWISNLFRGFLLCFFGSFFPASEDSMLGGAVSDRARYPEWFVLEVGADKPGDISSIGEWLCLDAAVITRFSSVPAHIEFFPSVESLLKEKAALAHSLKGGGLLALGSDDADVAALEREVRGKRVVRFGCGEEAEVRGSHYAVRYGQSGLPEGIVFRADIGGTSLPLSVRGALGVQHMQPLLAALAVCFGEGLNLVAAAEKFSFYEPPRGRMRLLRGINKTLIIDDSYNSSPVALREALVALGSLKTNGRKIALLGDMLELGKYAIPEHRKGGAFTASSCDMLCTVGALAKDFADGALSAGMEAEKIMQYSDSREAGKRLAGKLLPGDIVLVKGSAKMRMERAVEEFMAEPERAREFLARQEKEWGKRR